MNMTQELTLAFKTIFSALGGAVLAVAAPVAPYAAVCTLLSLIHISEPTRPY